MAQERTTHHESWKMPLESGVDVAADSFLARKTLRSLPGHVVKRISASTCCASGASGRPWRVSKVFLTRNSVIMGHARATGTAAAAAAR